LRKFKLLSPSSQQQHINGVETAGCSCSHQAALPRRTKEKGEKKESDPSLLGRAIVWEKGVLHQSYSEDF